MDIRENAEIWLFCAKFVNDIVLVSVERVSGLLLDYIVNIITHIRRIQRQENRSYLLGQFHTVRATRTLF
jgi:hypothetical protein